MDTGKRRALEVKQDRGNQPRASQARATAATGVAVVFWLATCVAQVIAPALPGWKSGIGHWIARLETTAALLSQLALVAGCSFAFWMLIEVLREHRLGIGFRIGAAPLAAAVLTTAIAASTQHLAALLSLGLSLMVGFLALGAAWTTSRSTQTRGLGLALGLVGLGAGFATMSRLLALRASTEALTSMFAVSRALATATYALGIIALVVGAVWVSQRRRPSLAMVLGAPVVLGVLGALAAQFGQSSSGDSVLVLVSRLVFELSRHPHPLLPTALQQMGNTTLLLGSGAALLGGGRSALGRAALCLALLPRAGTDIPLLALALGIASLVAPLCAAQGIAKPAMTTKRDFEAEAKD